MAIETAKIDRRTATKRSKSASSHLQDSSFEPEADQSREVIAKVLQPEIRPW